jgi:hypothetical protein
MPDGEINPITIPKKVFLELHKEDAVKFRAFVLSSPFQLAITCAQAEFSQRCPSQEAAMGVRQFLEIFQTIGEIDTMPKGPEKKSLSHPRATPTPPTSPRTT